jgi:hypothetical protein
VLAKKETPAPPRPRPEPDPTREADPTQINDLCKQLLDNHHDDEAEIRVVRQLRVAVHDYMKRVRERLTGVPQTGDASTHHQGGAASNSNHPKGATESDHPRD